MKLNEITSTEVDLIGMKIDDFKITGTYEEDTFDGNFDCSHFGVTSLRGAPENIYGKFDCSFNPISSLEHGPQYVEASYVVMSCERIRSLEHCAKQVGKLLLRDILIKDLEHASEFIHSTLLLSNLLVLTDLHDVHRHVKRVYTIQFSGMNIKSSVLGLLLVGDLKSIENTRPLGKDWEFVTESILPKYIPNTIGRSAVLQCQNELLDHGFDEYAKL